MEEITWLCLTAGFDVVSARHPLGMCSLVPLLLRLVGLWQGRDSPLTPPHVLQKKGKLYLA